MVESGRRRRRRSRSAMRSCWAAAPSEHAAGAWTPVGGRRDSSTHTQGQGPPGLESTTVPAAVSRSAAVRLRRRAYQANPKGTLTDVLCVLSLLSVVEADSWRSWMLAHICLARLCPTPS
jgi:hypothetical protein